MNCGASLTDGGRVYRMGGSVNRGGAGGRAFAEGGVNFANVVADMQMGGR